jgi:hypothetical protein
VHIKLTGLSKETRRQFILVANNIFPLLFPPLLFYSAATSLLFSGITTCPRTRLYFVASCSHRTGASTPEARAFESFLQHCLNKKQLSLPESYARMTEFVRRSTYMSPSVAFLETCVVSSWQRYRLSAVVLHGTLSSHQICVAGGWCSYYCLPAPRA